MGLADRLNKKGWSQAEIDHALSHLDRAQREKSTTKKVLEEAVYWFVMLVLAAANIAMSAFLFPFLSNPLYHIPASLTFVTAAMLGVVWGVLFGHLLHEIAELEPHRHSMVLFIASLTVALTALAVGRHSVALAIIFAVVFVFYYSVVWWRSQR